MGKAPKIFISYSHEDEAWKDLIKKFFKTSNAFEIWDDRDIKLGEHWLDAITQALDSCDIGIFLITVDFLKSDFIQNNEIPTLLEREKAKRVKIVPIIVYECPWKNHKWISLKQGYPRDNKPLASFQKIQHIDFQKCNTIAEELTNLAERVYREYQEESLYSDESIEDLPQQLNRFNQEEKNFLQSVYDSTFNITIDEFIQNAQKYISNQVYLNNIENQNSVQEMIKTLYDSSQKEDLASILHDLASQIELDEVLKAWIAEHYNPNNEQIIKEHLPSEEKNSDRIYVVMRSVGRLKYQVSIFPRYQKGNNSPRHFDIIDVSSEACQEQFISKFRGLRADIPIHLIVSEALYLENIRLWLKGSRKLTDLANPLYLHTLERFNFDVEDFTWMIEDWDNRFVAQNTLAQSLALLDSSDQGYSGEDEEENKLIGVCYHYQPTTPDEIYQPLDIAYVSLYPHTTQTEYQQKVIEKLDEISMEALPQKVKKCQHLALIWDEMRMLYDFKRELEQLN